MMIDDLLKNLYVIIQEGYIHWAGQMKESVRTKSCTLYELACKEKLCTCDLDWNQFVYRKKYKLPIFLNKEMNNIQIYYSLDPTKPFGIMPKIRDDGKTYLIRQIMVEVSDDLLMSNIYYGCLISTYVDNIISSVGYSFMPFINISIGFRLDFAHRDFYKFEELSDTDIQNILYEDYRVADVGRFKYIDGKITMS